MDVDDKFLVRGIQSLSSSAQSTPEKTGHSHYASISPELKHGFLKSGLKRELLQGCSDKDKKNPALSKSKMREPLKPTNNKTCKKQESRKASNSSPNQPSSKKRNRKVENPIRVPLLALEQTPDLRSSKISVCKNAACRATLSTDDSFCRRCSCCICHSYDDNKDPSLWFVCSSEHDEEDTCGFSCHIECALQHEKAGVVHLGQLMTLDGSYCCATCGKVSGILGWWKKQLAIAKDARRLDVLCYRIYLSYRILNGTSRFKALHRIVADAKAKLETEVGPINGVSAKRSCGIVSRLAVASDVQKLCSLGIEKADELLAMSTEDSRPASCKILFEELNPHSVSIVVIDSSSSVSSHDIKGHKLWYRKSGEETFNKEPAFVFPGDRRKIRIPHLQPCTEYVFRLISFTETAELGHSEAKCSTLSAENLNRCRNSTHAVNGIIERTGIESANMTAGSLGFKVRDSGKILQATCGQSQGRNPEGFCNADTEKCCTTTIELAAPGTAGKDQARSVLCGLDLNVALAPDPIEATPVFENSGAGEDILRMDNIVKSLRNGGNSREDMCRKRLMTKEEAHDSDSTLINGSSSPSHFSSVSGCLDQNYEYCVKKVRRLEWEGLIDRDFRLKFLTWFSLRSTEQERRVVNTFIQTMADDPGSLAGQLVDSFSEIVSTKRPRNWLCSSKA